MRYCQALAEVYPRACGGTEWLSSTSSGDIGLSPRLRGNHGWRIQGNHNRRSIPAPAGEPTGDRVYLVQHEVYPRACGGTRTAHGQTTVIPGLSPRLRGNRNRGGQPGHDHRSIPAPAGEPRGCYLCLSNLRVYPRACGGTRLFSPSISIWKGLSPRLRGNQQRRAACVVLRRSIPAPAGEPQCAQIGPDITRVYPRACGGTRLYTSSSRPK